MSRNTPAWPTSEIIPGAFCLAKPLRVADPRSVHFSCRRSEVRINGCLCPPSPVSSPPGEDFNQSHFRFVRQRVRTIQPQVFPKKLGAFLLLLGEKAGMREDVKPTLCLRARHFNRRRSSAGFREPCQMVLMTTSEVSRLMAK